MRIDELGELSPHEDIPEWLVSEQVAVPYFAGAKMRFILDNIAEDERPDDFAAAVARFLALTPADRDRAAPELFKCYRKFCNLAGQPRVTIENATKVWNHVEPVELHIARDGTPRGPVSVQIAANCEWDVEHGLQLLYRGGNQLVEVGPHDS